MRAILIKPESQEIIEVNFQCTLEHAYKLLDCHIIEGVKLRNGDRLWVDEEGRLSGRTIQKGWFFLTETLGEGAMQFVGRALITADGDWKRKGRVRDSKSTIAGLTAKIKFVRNV